MNSEKLKKILICVIVCILVVAVLIILAFRMNTKNEQNREEKIASAINTKLNLDMVFADIEKLYTNTNSEPQEIPTELSGEEFDKSQDNTDENIDGSKVIKGEEIKDYLDFGDLSKIEMGAYINTDDEHIDEVWIVKLDKMENQEKVARLLGNRMRKLKEGFKENKTELMVIESSEIKQENDVVIMIASPNKASIENIIAKEMTKE